MATTKNTAGQTTGWLLAGIIATLSSCAPTPVVVEEPPVKKPAEKKLVEAVVPEEPLPLPPDDGVRMSGMLDLPSDSQFRSASPSKTGPDTGAIYSRPPTDPPARVKPEAKEPE